jgi:hypothetical protein
MAFEPLRIDKYNAESNGVDKYNVENNERGLGGGRSHAFHANRGASALALERTQNGYPHNKKPGAVVRAGHNSSVSISQLTSRD